MPAMYWASAANALLYRSAIAGWLNARGYTLVALATLVVFLAAARAIERDSPGALAVVAVAGALGLYAVPIMTYPLGGALLWRSS